VKFIFDINFMCIFSRAAQEFSTNLTGAALG